MSIFNDYSVSSNKRALTWAEKAGRSSRSSSELPTLDSVIDSFLLSPVRDLCNIVMNYYAYFVVCNTVTPFSQFYVQTSDIKAPSQSAGATFQGIGISPLNLPSLLWSSATTTPYISLVALTRPEAMLTLTDVSRLFSANLSAIEIVLKSTATNAISTRTGSALMESEPFTTQSVETSSLSSNHETTSDSRFQKAANPVFKYDFKVGNYLQIGRAHV